MVLSGIRLYHMLHSISSLHSASAVLFIPNVYAFVVNLAYQESLRYGHIGEETIKNYKGLHYGTEAAHFTQIKSELFRCSVRNSCLIQSFRFCLQVLR